MDTILTGTPQCLRSFHSESLSTLSNAFSQSMKLTQRGVLHSRDCSKIILSVAIWSVHDRFLLKPAWLSLSFGSTAFFKRFRITLLNILPGTERSEMPLQLEHELRSPFLGIFVMYPSFQSLGMSSLSHMSLNSVHRTSVLISSIPIQQFPLPCC